MASKYACPHQCEVCGRGIILYYSHPRSAEWGLGIMLCERHARRLTALPDEKALAVLRYGGLFSRRWAEWAEAGA